MSQWFEVALSDVFRLSLDPHPIDPGMSYITAGVAGHGRGMISRPAILGRDLSVTQLFRVRAGQFIYRKLTAHEGTFAVVRSNYDSCYVTSEFPTFDINEAIADPRFIEWYFRKPSLWREVAVQSKGTVKRRMRLHPTELLSYRIPLPPLDEQRRIVSLLDRAVAIRRLREEALAKARAVGPALFLDMFGDPGANPKGWPVTELGSLLEEEPRNGLSPATGGRVNAQVLTLTAVTGDGFDNRAIKDGMFARQPRENDFVSTRDFLICRGNGNPNLVGCGQFATADLPDVVFPDTIIAIRPAPSRINPSFLEAVWSSAANRTRLRAQARTTNGTFKINQRMVTEAPVIGPPLGLQCRFADRLADLRSIVAQAERALAVARDLERSLMARLLG